MSTKAYWERRYESLKRNDDKRNFAKSFEWLVDFRSVKEHIWSAIATESTSFLDLGCGTSRFAVDFHNACRARHIPAHMCLVDYVREALYQQQALFRGSVGRGTFPCDHNALNIEPIEHANNASMPDLQNTDELQQSVTEDSSGFMTSPMQQKLPQYSVSFLAADVTDLPFVSGMFDVVFDKGTMDSLLKGNRGETHGANMVAEAMRVLRPGGLMIQITDEDPELRVDLLESIAKDTNLNLRISFRSLDSDTASGFSYFIYHIRIRT